MLVAHVLERGRRIGHLECRLRLDLHGDQRAGDLELHRLDERPEQFEGFALVLLLRVLLRVPAQVDALAQMVERRQVLAPVRIEDLQHDVALVLAIRIFGARGHLGGIGLVGLADDALQQVLVAQLRLLLQPLLDGQLQLEVGGERFFERRDVPLLLDALGRHVHAQEVRHHAGAQVRDPLRHVLGIQQLVPQLVDGPALVVRNVVVLEKLLPDVEVARLDLALCAFDRVGDHAVLDGLALGHLEHDHDLVDALAREDAQQRILEREVEARRARVALPPGPAAQLVVDAPRLVPLGADDVQPAFLDHVVVQLLPFALEGLDARVLFALAELFVRLDELALLLDVAAKHDVRAAARHVGRDGDHLGPARLRDDLRLAGVLLGVQHLVREVVGTLQHPGEQLGALDRGRAHEDRLATRVAILDVLDDGVVLFLVGPEHLVEAVVAYHRPVGRDHHGLQAVDLLEFVGFRIGRAGHARQARVHAEVVLEGDRGEGLVLGLDLDVFLGFDRLVQAVGPAPAGHQSSGELVDDDDFAVLHHVLLVAVEQVVGAQRRIQMMHEVDECRLVQAGAFGKQPDPPEDFFGVRVPGLGQQDLVVLLIDPEVARTVLRFLLGEERRHLVHPVVELGAILRLAGNDQRRARLVDQDRVNLVDNGENEAALVAVLDVHRHVVAQVVEAEFVIRAVGDIGRVGDPLFLRLELGKVHAHSKAQEPVEAPHPVRIALGKVIVDRDNVDALARDRVQVGRQRRHQRLAFARAHLGDLAGMQHHAAEQLDVEVAHPEGAHTRLADHGERLGQQVVEGFPGAEALAEFVRLGAQRVIGQRLDRRLERIDALDVATVGLEQALVAAAEYRGEELGDHAGRGRLRRTQRANDPDEAVLKKIKILARHLVPFALQDG